MAESRISPSRTRACVKVVNAMRATRLGDLAVEEAGIPSLTIVAYGHGIADVERIP